MVKRRGQDAGVDVSGLCCHSFRATAITLYMQNGGQLAEAQKLANHADPRTTKLYDRSSDQVSLTEIERIRFRAVMGRPGQILKGMHRASGQLHRR